jgi:protein arginine N-methyltransferase 1
MAFDEFADPWEQLRLLADERRNGAYLELLRRRAPGARVLEVGTGTGLLACIAARLGARRVYAVEASELSDLARQLVADTGLAQVVQVLPGTIEEHSPTPVDLAFGELLNADPLAEGVVDAMAAAAPWVVPGGTLAPSRLRIYAALTRDCASADEAQRALTQVRGWAQEFGLQLGAVEEYLSSAEPMGFLAPNVELCSKPALVCDLPLGQGELPDDETEVAVEVQGFGPAGGAVIWFEAQLDEGLVLSNGPPSPGHFGLLQSAWAEPLPLPPPGKELTLCVTCNDDHLSVEPA